MNAARSSKTLFSFQAMAPSKAMPLYTHPCLRIVSPPMYPDRTNGSLLSPRGEGKIGVFGCEAACSFAPMLPEPRPGRLARLWRSPYVLLALVPLFWSGNFIVGRAVHGTVPPIALSFWRWFGAL